MTQWWSFLHLVTNELQHRISPLTECPTKFPALFQRDILLLENALPPLAEMLDHFVYGLLMERVLTHLLLPGYSVESVLNRSPRFLNNSRNLPGRKSFITKSTNLRY